MATLHERVVALERNQVRHDKQIESIRRLVEQGMRIVVKLGADQRKLHADQLKLHADVRELTNSLRRGTNGHNKRKLDLQ